MLQEIRGVEYSTRVSILANPQGAEGVCQHSNVFLHLADRKKRFVLISIILSIRYIVFIKANWAESRRENRSRNHDKTLYISNRRVIAIAKWNGHAADRSFIRYKNQE